MKINLFKGPSVLTKFRFNEKCLGLKEHFPELALSDIRYHYLVETEGNVSDAAFQSQVIRLLPEGAQLVSDANQTDCTFWVVPRIGTISPWSSKATDIFKRCGLDSVLRVERIKGVLFEGHASVTEAVYPKFHDALTESVIETPEKLTDLFDSPSPERLNRIPVLSSGMSAIKAANNTLGLGLTESEYEYLLAMYQSLKRDPTDVELMMFAQVNSEHCRHKIFNAAWEIDGVPQKHTLFDMIRHTHRSHPDQVLVAYDDNAAVLKGYSGKRLMVDPKTQTYTFREQSIPIVLKVETHNHPTGIAPFPGAATGSGGEIRDEAATGRGSTTKAGLCGFSVSQIDIPGFQEPWALEVGKPAGTASSLDIMLDGPIGAAAFNNEFGRPNILGYFRTFLVPVVPSVLSVIPAQSGIQENRQPVDKQAYRGYHKPIMLAGGIGTIDESHIKKHDLPTGALLIVLGGPAMAIGLGGGSASSQASGSLLSELDFASVQRANPEMQRRCQEVINTCTAMAEDNPILSIHDVGAGGLSNALPELVEACGQGAEIDLRQIPNDEPGMSPLAIWCNEAQERYVLAILPETLDQFTAIAKRERCLMAVVGHVQAEDRLHVVDPKLKDAPVDLPLTQLLGSLPQTQCKDQTATPHAQPFNCSEVELSEAIDRILRFPCVADKRFLITIGDRTVGGLTARDQMVGPWQVAVADVAVTASDYHGYCGEAIAMGERAPVALLNPAASARLVVGEAITNLAAASIESISKISLSANWMASASQAGEGAGLYAAVETVGRDFCPALGISIPVGKDSLSMTTRWNDQNIEKTVTSPLSLIVTAAAPVNDIRNTLTPELQFVDEPTVLCLFDLGDGTYPLGGSVLAQVFGELGDVTPDINPTRLKVFFELIQALNKKGLLLAYHDRSDGGLLTSVSEMQFCSHLGVDLQLPVAQEQALPYLFHESLGAVIQVTRASLSEVAALVEKAQLQNAFNEIGAVNSSDTLKISCGETVIYQASRLHLNQQWSLVSYHMQRLRDNSECAESEYRCLDQTDDPGLVKAMSYQEKNILISAGKKPRVAILREQGVNGHREMAAAFMMGGFDAVDVTMSDLISGATLEGFQGIAACGGFSYGDVLGAGRGWAKSILEHKELYDQFAAFFDRNDTFTLGVCNGCQMLSQLKEIIPGAGHWPRFIRNQSEQFEARFLMVKVADSPSLFFKGMAGQCLPVPVAHAEGLVDFSEGDATKAVLSLQYVDHQQNPTEQYPFNPNGSANAAAGFTTTDGRVTILMPHPERVFRFEQWSVRPKNAQGLSPWVECFRGLA